MCMYVRVCMYRVYVHVFIAAYSKDMYKRGRKILQHVVYKMRQINQSGYNRVAYYTCFYIGDLLVLTAYFFTCSHGSHNVQRSMGSR